MSTATDLPAKQRGIWASVVNLQNSAGSCELAVPLPGTNDWGMEKLHKNTSNMHVNVLLGAETGRRADGSKFEHANW